MQTLWRVATGVVCVWLIALVAVADDVTSTALQTADITVATAEEREPLLNQVQMYQQRRLQAANQKSSAEWQAIKSRDEWQRYRIEKLAALKASLGRWPEVPQPLPMKVVGTVAGDGFQIDNIVFESRPGWWVSANLYRPTKQSDSMPGFVICHAHHTPKEHGELQDMGMTWARAGCLVLVPDQVGHGERRQHPFGSAADYPKPYRVGPADYYFRYDSALQLHLVGESLVGWMAWDMMRCADVLLQQPGCDSKRLILLGSVAGGGDPVAVTGALDERFAAVVPFNFGGPQPETRYPLSADAETTFNYAGSGSWESTRNLRLSARDGFLPWVIVGSMAPRRLIYAHEFRWDQERDPVWKRLQSLYAWHEQPTSLAFTHGKGAVTGQSADDTHCTHIGRVQRALMHVAFQDWFGINVRPEDEYRQRVPTEQLRCWNADLRRELQPQTLSQQVQAIAARQFVEVSDLQQRVSPSEFRQELQQRWRQRLGTSPAIKPVVRDAQQRGNQRVGEATLERWMLTVEDGLRVPVIVVVPKTTKGPAVVAFSSRGKQEFWKQRADDIATWLNSGRVVCLLDPRGIGESRLGEGHGRRSSATSISSTELMLGDTLLGHQLADVRAVLHWLRSRTDLKVSAFELRGESMVSTNADDALFRQPRDDDSTLPAVSQPAAPLLALLSGLFEDDVIEIQTTGGLTTWQSLLTSYLVLTSHASLVPDVCSIGELSALIAAQRPNCKVTTTKSVDGWNRTGLSMKQ